MRVKLFTLRYSATLGGFDERPLLEFIRDREILSCREHFFAVNDVPHLTCLLTWQAAVVVPGELSDAVEGEARPDALRARRRTAKADPTAALDESQRLTFSSLREWRRDTAREEGVPPYVVFTNRELVAIVVERPESATALGLIAGIGPGKVERYGEQVLALLEPRGGDLVASTADTEANS